MGAAHSAKAASRENPAHLKTAARVIAVEQAALAELAAGLDGAFARAVELMLDAPGKVAVLGIGKSGHIAHKTAATLASTGTPAFFLHAAEAGHGDMGVVDKKDAALAFSWSGESDELKTALPAVKNAARGVIAVTAREDSTLARAADVRLIIKISREACPHNLAPTASTTAMLALGDALALALMEARGFRPDDFARTHPAGALGRRLTVRAGDIMRTGNALPTAAPAATLAQVVPEMSAKRMGMVLLVEDGRLCGIFTDGDLRRAFARLPDDAGVAAAPMKTLMNKKPITIGADMLAAAALDLMKEKNINQLAVTDEHGALQGALTMQDILQRGI